MWTRNPRASSTPIAPWYHWICRTNNLNFLVLGEFIGGGCGLFFRILMKCNNILSLHPFLGYIGQTRERALSICRDRDRLAGILGGKRPV
jgi:hypothetical protein